MKLLIVDDESTTRNGLMKHVKWGKLGIKQLREASDGQEALELLESYQPDILITDIRMPRMNGIELATHVREKYAQCKLIFLSGYSDKEYLKAAIHLGVIHYVEKPIDISEVEEAVSKAVKLFQEDNKKDLAYELTDASKQELIERLIRKNEELPVYLERLERMGLNMTAQSPLSVMLVKVSEAVKDIKVTKELFEKSMLEHIDPHRILGAVKDARHILWILALSERELKQVMPNVLDTIESNDVGLTKKVFIGIGSQVNGIDLLYESYQTAVITLQNLFFKGYGSVVYYKKPIITTELEVENILQEFGSLIQASDYEKVKDYIQQLFSKLYWQENMLVNDIKNIFFQLCQDLYQEGEKRVSYQREDSAEREPYLWEKVFQIETMSELHEFMNSELETVMGAIHTSGIYSKSIVIVKKMIETQYMVPDLSTKTLADKVYLTSTYLSSLFKKEMGITISDYLIQVRMEASKVYLKEMKLKLSEVAAKVGYSDANYYAKTFKKSFGLTPSEFRERQMP